MRSGDSEVIRDFRFRLSARFIANPSALHADDNHGVFQLGIGDPRLRVLSGPTPPPRPRRSRHSPPQAAPCPRCDSRALRLSRSFRVSVAAAATTGAAPADADPEGPRRSLRPGYHTLGHGACCVATPLRCGGGAAVGPDDRGAWVKDARWIVSTSSGCEPDGLIDSQTIRRRKSLSLRVAGSNQGAAAPRRSVSERQCANGVLGSREG